MRTLLFLLCMGLVVGLAYWAYTENYHTKAELDEVERLNREIGTARARLAILRAEWAYLNRPSRLRDLADLNFDRLGLLPMEPSQFGRIDEISLRTAETLRDD